MVFVVVTSFYAWMASPERWLFSAPGTGGEYYNLLVDGFRSGHLSLKSAPARALAALKDPYDPRLNAPYRLHDVSYFHGSYFLYFGVVPAIGLYWPWLAFTGRYLTDAQACTLCAAVGLVFWFVLLYRLRRRFLPDHASWELALGAFGLGLGTMMPSLLARVGIWEVPIAAAYTLTGLAAYLVFQTCYGRRPVLALAGASLAYGLAIGSRPTWVFGAIALMAPVYAVWRRAESRQDVGVVRRYALAALLPIGICVLALAAYNYARFGNPAEFGQTYQLSGMNEHAARHFALSYLGYNTRIYLLSSARFSPYFPFVRVVDAPPAPVGYLGIEDPYGVLVDIPLTIFILGLVVAWRRLGGLQTFVATLGLIGLLTALTVFSFGGACNRYMVEFLPIWLLLALLGVWFGAQACSRAAGLAVKALGYGCVVISCMFNLFAALGHNELLRVNHPSAYAPIAHALNWPSYLAMRAAGAKSGSIELTLRFPAGQTGRYEPLLVSGISFLSDYVWVFYPSANHVVFGFEHTSYGGKVGKPLMLDFDQPHRVTIEAGFLYPPANNPYFDGMKPAWVRELKSRVRILVDGTEYLHTRMDLYDPVRFEPLVGQTSDGRDAFGRKFTGAVMLIRRVDEPELIRPFSGNAPLRLELVLPRFTGVRSEPLVTTGRNGTGDSLFVTYLDNHHIKLGLDHWNFGGPQSAPIEVNQEDRQTVVVSLGSFYPQLGPPGAKAGSVPDCGRWLFVSWNGLEVFNQPQPFYASAPGEFHIGSNAIGSSTSDPEFKGDILEQSAWRGPLVIKPRPQSN